MSVHIYQRSKSISENLPVLFYLIKVILEPHSVWYNINQLQTATYFSGSVDFIRLMNALVLGSWCRMYCPVGNPDTAEITEYSVASGW